MTKGWLQLALIVAIVICAFSPSPGFGVFFAVILAVF
jgi:hypothetical protein